VLWPPLKTCVSRSTGMLTLRAIKIPGPRSPDLRAGVFQCAPLKLIFGSQSRNQVNTVRTRPLYRIIGAPEVVTPFEIGIGEVGHPLRVGCVGVRLITLCCRCLAHTRAETVGYLSVRLR
jgi:hypothetical protein